MTPERTCVRDATATAVLGTALAAGVAAVVGVAQSSPAILVAAATALGSLPAMLTAVGMLRRTPRTSTPADRVSLSRAVLASGCAAVSTMAVADAVSVRTWWFVLLAATTLLLDAVDGAVARATGTASAAGARLDMELDAGVLVVLSIAAATVLGWWVLLIAAMRYLYLGASFLWPVLDTPLPTSQFRRTVAALQGGALVVALAPVIPIGVAGIAVLVALVLLLTSFAQQAVLATRPERAADISTGAERFDSRHPVRRLAAVVSTILAFLLVWVALVAPVQLSRLTPGAFVRIPLEGLALVVLALVLPTRPSRIVAATFGLALGALLLVKILDMGFFAVFDRPFDLLNDWAYLGPGIGVLGDSIGHGPAVATAVAAVVLAVAVLVVMPLCVVRLTRLVATHRRVSVRAVTAIGVVWIISAVFGLQFAPDARVASTGAADLAVAEVNQVLFDIHDRKTFGKLITADPFSSTPDNRLLTGLQGKDVILAFVESYGRVAVENSTFSPQVDAVLDAGTQQLGAAGFSTRSAWLTSPTFGAGSWLAHSTLQSGLWVNSQQRYDQLLSAQRLTLTDAFGRAGWRTVLDVPANTQDWPEGTSFYHDDKLYDSRNVGYRGPTFSYATMPDQYVLSAFQRRELSRKDRAPVMAEIDLVSSHHPWAPLPHLVDWNAVGDGSVFDGMPAQGESPDTVFRDPDKVRAAYGQSIEYSLSTLISFVKTYPDPNLVIIMLGDHQPHSYVTGAHPGHDVPISIIAHDPAVMDRITGWGWQNGLKPGAKAPTWRMDLFRDRFLTAYGPRPSSDPSATATRSPSPVPQ